MQQKKRFSSEAPSLKRKRGGEQATDAISTVSHSISYTEQGGRIGRIRGRPGIAWKTSNPATDLEIRKVKGRKRGLEGSERGLGEGIKRD